MFRKFAVVIVIIVLFANTLTPGIIGPLVLLAQPVKSIRLVRQDKDSSDPEQRRQALNPIKPGRKLLTSYRG